MISQTHFRRCLGRNQMLERHQEQERRKESGSSDSDMTEQFLIDLLCRPGWPPPTLVTWLFHSLARSQAKLALSKLEAWPVPAVEEASGALEFA
ncbi:hypothetical protein E4U53_007291 [Claviceps sorghi]|nr:hypothetical protein E4U53_007291 [Claviceps sorghi]